MIQRKLYKYSIALLTVALLVTCSKVPSEILSEKKMKDVMIDMQLAENIANDNYNTYRDSIHKAALYESVFRKHNTTQAIYDSSLVWYGKNLNILLQVYDLAINDVNDHIRNLGDVQASAAPSANQDSVNIWPRRNYMTFEPGALFNGTIFNIRPDAPYTSGSIFVMGMRVWGLNPQMHNTPEVRLTAVMQDTTIVVNRKIQTDGFHEIMLRTPATKRINCVYGYIRMDNAETKYYKIYVDSLNLIKYNYDRM